MHQFYIENPVLRDGNFTEQVPMDIIAINFVSWLSVAIS